ncbi:MAG: TraR/DksA C4-type zinc finger protein [Candidatus Rokubacteria bacterium]|nr:TraR/DksA C4-type zinc finger protein [Candidatus Rokubacteria bacterium]
MMAQILNAALVEEFRRRLREMRERLFRTAATSDEELQTLEAHQPGAPAEDVARESVTTLLSRLSGREKRELDEVYAAQARLETGTFGICEGCGRAVPLARLRAMPAARTCVACEAREEERAR